MISAGKIATLNPNSRRDWGFFMADFYDWTQTLSYDADVTMVIGARGLGKTYGLRKRFIQDWLKDGSRFVEVCRYKNELSGVSDGYFNRVGDEFPDLDFRTDAKLAYVSRKDEKNENGKRVWQVIGYFCALSDAQAYKKRTFNKVRRMVLDEAIIERADRFHRYLPNEFAKLANLVDTVSRERADTKSIRPRVYLLGNACDISNPYFAAYRVATDLKFGYAWYRNKTFLLHYVESRKYGREKLTQTVAGRMMAGTQEAQVAANNEFIGETMDFVVPKPKRAKYMFGIVVNNRKFGIWCDLTEGLYHVTGKCPNDATRPVYALTASDNGVNYVMAKKAEPVMKSFSEVWYMGLVRYDNIQVKTDFNEVLALFGIR